MTVHPVTTNGGSPDPPQQNTPVLVGKQLAAHHNLSVNNSITTMNNNNTVLVNGTPGSGPPSLPSAVVTPNSAILNNKSMVSLGPGQNTVNMTLNNNNSSGPATLNTNGMPIATLGGVNVLNKPVGLIPGTQQLQQQQMHHPGMTGGAVVTTSFGGANTILSSSVPLTTPGHQQPTYITNSGAGIQLVNMNNVRMNSGGGPVTMASNMGGTPTKPQPSRMILGQQMIGARPGTPGVGVYEYQSEFSEFLMKDYKDGKKESGSSRPGSSLADVEDASDSSLTARGTVLTSTQATILSPALTLSSSSPKCLSNEPEPLESFISPPIPSPKKLNKEPDISQFYPEPEPVPSPNHLLGLDVTSHSDIILFPNSSNTFSPNHCVQTKSFSMEGNAEPSLEFSSEAEPRDGPCDNSRSTKRPPTPPNVSVGIEPEPYSSTSNSAFNFEPIQIQVPASSASSDWTTNPRPSPVTTESDPEPEVVYIKPSPTVQTQSSPSHVPQRESILVGGPHSNPYSQPQPSNMSPVIRYSYATQPQPPSPTYSHQQSVSQPHIRMHPHSQQQSGNESSAHAHQLPPTHAQQQPGNGPSAHAHQQSGNVPSAHAHQQPGNGPSAHAQHGPPLHSPRNPNPMDPFGASPSKGPMPNYNTSPVPRSNPTSRTAVFTTDPGLHFQYLKYAETHPLPQTGDTRQSKHSNPDPRNSNYNPTSPPLAQPPRPPYFDPNAKNFRQPTTTVLRQPYRGSMMPITSQSIRQHYYPTSSYSSVSTSAPRLSVPSVDSMAQRSVLHSSYVPPHPSSSHQSVHMMARPQYDPHHRQLRPTSQVQQSPRLPSPTLSQRSPTSWPMHSPPAPRGQTNIQHGAIAGVGGPPRGYYPSSQVPVPQQSASAHPHHHSGPSIPTSYNNHPQYRPYDHSQGRYPTTTPIPPRPSPPHFQQHMENSPHGTIMGPGPDPRPTAHQASSFAQYSASQFGNPDQQYRARPPSQQMYYPGSSGSQGTQSTSSVPAVCRVSPIRFRGTGSTDHPNYHPYPRPQYIPSPMSSPPGLPFLPPQESSRGPMTQLEFESYKYSHEYSEAMRKLSTQFTLQALPGLQPGAQGGHHLLVKTENGQYQLLRVGLPPSAPNTTAATGTPPSLPPSSPSTTVAPTTTQSSVILSTPTIPTITPPTRPGGSTPPVAPPPPVTTVAATTTVPTTPPTVSSTSTGVGSKGSGPRVPTPSGNTNHTNSSTPNPPIPPTTTRLPSVPSVPPTATSNSPSGMGMTASMSMQQMHPVVPPHPHALQSHLPSSVLTSANASTTTATATSVSQMSSDTAKTKCKNFLSFLLELSAKQNQTVARNVKGLIQGLVDGKVNAEDFSDRLQKEVNSQPQPCLVGFLKKSLPPLRHSLATKELTIDGIRPPPVSSVSSVPPVTALIPQTPTQPKVRPPPPVQVPTTPVRIITPISTSTPSGAPPVTATAPPIPRSTAAAVQQRFSSPKTNVSAKAAKAAAAKEKAEALAASAAASSASPKLTGPSAKATKEKVDKKAFASSSGGGAYGDDDINDVAAMGGVNLAEESQRILGSTEMIGTQIRSCKDEALLHSIPLQSKIKAIAAKYGLDEPPPEVAAMISHATEERLKTLLEKLSVIAEHRLDVIKMDDRYEVTQDVKGQLRFLEDLDKLERKRHDEEEREMLIKAAKSRSKSEDPEQAKLKAKAKEMQRVAQEEMRQREANLTALQAIGPRKKQKLDSPSGSQSTTTQSPLSGLGALSSPSRPQMGMRPRLKRVNLRDLLFVLEQEKETTRSQFLYKHFLK